MGLQTTININVDFYDNKYIMLNAKQYDDASRWIAVTCYNQGELFNISSNKHTAYIRYKKADGNGVLNACRINYKGEVLVELTEQMLAAEGVCYVDLIIVNKGSAVIDIDTGSIVTIDNSEILSTMAFSINVYASAIDNSAIESSYEYDALNEALKMVNANYEEVIQLARSYAIGDANDIRENEDYDNSKYYCEVASEKANNASVSAANAAVSEANAATSEANAAESEANAAESEDISKECAESSESSKNSALASANSAFTSEVNANISATSASESAASASESAEIASESAESASENAETVYNYYVQIDEVATGLNGAFIPQYTVEFAELATLLESGEVEAGYLYNVSDSFTTDDTFKCGAGVEYEAGTNVYFTSDGYWDCLTASTVTGLKGDSEDKFRKGNVNITADNVGAIPSEDKVTVDEIKAYLEEYSYEDDGIFNPFYTYGTEDLVDGESLLDTGKLYFVYSIDSSESDSGDDNGSADSGDDTPSVETLTFTYNSTEYTAESGMTWAEWLESDYYESSTLGFSVDSSTNHIVTAAAAAYHLVDSSLVYVLSTDVIVSGAAYSDYIYIDAGDAGGGDAGGGDAGLDPCGMGSTVTPQ